MSQKVFFIKLLLVHYATQNTTEIASCDDDVSLKCPVVDIAHMDFLSVTWYKITKERQNGIIKRDKDEEHIQYYNFPRPASFGPDYSLLLRRVTPADSGRYMCAITANVGGQNQYPITNLTVNVCVTQAGATTVARASNATQADLPVLWSIGGFVAVGLTKIILSLIGIWVIRAAEIRSRRRQMPEW